MLVFAPISIILVLSILLVSVVLFYYREVKYLHSQLKEYITHEEYIRIKIKHLYRFVTFGRLSAGLFHDLANLFQHIVIQVDQIEKCGNNMSEARQYIVRFVLASKRMSKFIRSIRKQIKTEGTEQMFSMVDEINEVISILEYSAREACVNLSFEVCENICTYGNPIKFHQVILNLISNAIDASDLKDNCTRTICIVLSKQNTHATLLVEDNGCGISQELLPKIFDPFFSTKPPEKGMGLGLSTTREAVEKYFNGTISVTSTEGKGSLFNVYIPIQGISQ